MRDDTIMKVKDMKLEAQSLFLGVCVHNYAPSRVEGLHRRFPLIVKITNIIRTQS